MGHATRNGRVKTTTSPSPLAIDLESPPSGIHKFNPHRPTTRPHTHTHTESGPGSGLSPPRPNPGPGPLAHAELFWRMPDDYCLGHRAGCQCHMGSRHYHVDGKSSSRVALGGHSQKKKSIAGRGGGAQTKRAGDV